MAKGIIYIMSTVVDGLIKIGKTDNFEKRMWELERNGYCNVTGLKRQFAIEVDNYSEKEKLLHDILSNSKLENAELFFLDLNLAKQLLSAFEGTIIFPKKESKEEIFEEATSALKSAEEYVLENALEDKDFVKESLRNKHHFKDIEFTSSLTGREYKGTTNKETGKLMIIDIESGEEIPNYSKPSKKAIVQQAISDIGEVPLDTLYTAYGQLVKLKSKQ